MKRWESLVDQKIREGMEQGDFDDLAGKGAPIDLSEHPFEDPDWRTAHRMLRNAGFASAWIEERKEIERDLSIMRSKLAQTSAILRNAYGTEYQAGAELRWQQSLTSFRQQAVELNKRILDWNLKTPGSIFQRNLINAEREIQEIQNPKADNR